MSKAGRDREVGVGQGRDKGKGRTRCGTGSSGTTVISTALSSTGCYGVGAVLVYGWVAFGLSASVSFVSLH